MISVIVPVYNIEEYLPRCLDSILAQTYTELEIILVDDGSTDCSGVICDQYAKKDKRIKVIHKENGGVSSARNIGLDRATGEYIGFVDGDDLLDDKMFEVLLKNAEEQKCDISCCQFATIDLQGNQKSIYNDISQILNSEYIISNFFFDPFIKELMYSVYSKIYKYSLIEELRYKSYSYGEDILFVFETLERSQKVYYDNYVGYYYVQRENSAMTAAFSKKRLEYINAIKEIEVKCKIKYPFAYKNASIWVYQHTLVTLRQIFANKMQNELREFVVDSKVYLKEHKQNMTYLSSIRKLDYYIIMYFPVIMPLVYSLSKKVKK